MNLFIIETTTLKFVFYTILEADDIQEAIEIKAAATSTKGGRVTGALRATSIGYPFFGEAMMDVTLAPPPPPLPAKYVLTRRESK